MGLRFLTALSLLLLAVTQASAAPLHFRGDQNYPPYEFLDEKGDPAGFAIDITRAVAEAMGLGVEIRLGPWSEVRGQLERGRIDGLVGMSYSAQRDRLVDFSSAYLRISHAIFVRKGTAVDSLNDLRDKEVLVTQGDIMHDFLKSSDLPVRIVAVENQNDALRLLSSGRHDAALLARMQGLYLAEKFDLRNLKAVGPPLEPRLYGFAVAEGNAALLTLLNEGLSLLKATGRYEEIYRKWFGVYEKRSIARDILRYAAWGLTPILVLLALAVAWSWSLKRRVARKTEELEAELLERRKAEEALESQKKFRQFVEASPVPMAIIEHDQSVHYINRKFTELFGYSLDDAPHMKAWWALAYPDEEYRASVMEKWEALVDEFAGGKAEMEPQERAVTCKDGSLRHVVFWLSSIGERYYVVFNDITTRKEAEEALQESERRFRSFFSASSAGMALIDLDGGLLQVNRALCDYTGYEEDELLGLTVADLTHPDDRERARLLYDGLRQEEGRTSHYEKRYLRKDGGIVWGHASVACVRDSEGRPSYFVALVQDTTERNRAETALKKSEARIKGIFNNVAAGIDVLDAEGRFVEVNDRLAEMLGYSREELLGRNPIEFTSPEDREKSRELLHKSLAGKLDAYRLEKRYRRKDGSVFWGELAFTRVIDEKGEGGADVGIVFDITERKRIEEKLIAANRELEAFVYTVSHDLRTPLTPIIGYADIIRGTYGERLDGQCLGYLEEIKNQGRKMLALMEDLLELAKVGHLEAPADPVEASEVASGVIEELGELIEAAGVSVSLSPLPALRVPETLLSQLFNNLIGNALFYGCAEGGTIEVGGERKGATVSFFVRDRGPGIPQEERDRIFEVFYRGTTGKKVRGTGVGLATVAKIASSYGGKAWVEETPGGGSTFRVRIVDARREGDDRRA